MIGLLEQTVCIDREIRLRKKVYPRFVRDGKLTAGAADIEIRRMEAVLRTLKYLQSEYGNAWEAPADVRAVPSRQDDFLSQPLNEGDGTYRP